MATLRENININDYLMDKVSKQIYFVVTMSLHDVLLRLEGDGNERPVEEKPKHYVNKYLIKVNPETVKLLYNKSENDKVLQTADMPDEFGK